MFTRTVFVRAFVVSMAAMLVFAPYQASAAYVRTDYIQGNLEQGEWVYYGTQRTTNAYPFRISMGKTDGPAIHAYYFGCGPSSPNDSGIAVYFPNDDNDTAHRRLRETSSYGITFCLAAYSYGNDNTDTFDAELSYWRQ